MLKYFVKWRAGENRRSKEQGWFLTNDSDGKYYIGKISYPSDWEGLSYSKPKFKSDNAAQNFVIQRALQGDLVALKALYMVGHEWEQEVEINDKKHHGIPDGILMFVRDVSKISSVDLTVLKLEQKIDQLEAELNRLDPDRYNYAKGT